MRRMDPAGSSSAARRALTLPLVVGLSLTAACGGGDSGGPGTGGGTSSTSTGGTSSTTTSSTTTSSTTTSSTSTTKTGVAELCTNPPANTAPQISDVYTSAAMPPSGTATGGTIVSGTYFMTAITDYESTDSGGTHKDTLVIDAAASTFVVDEVNHGTQKPTIAGSFTASGHTFNQTLVCPAPVTAALEYTYAAGVLTFYEYNSKSVSVWTKQ